MASRAVTMACSGGTLPSASVEGRRPPGTLTSGCLEVRGGPDGSANFGPVTAGAAGFPTDSSGMRGFSDHQAVPCWEVLHFFEGLAG